MRREETGEPVGERNYPPCEEEITDHQDDPIVSIWPRALHKLRS